MPSSRPISSCFQPSTSCSTSTARARGGSLATACSRSDRSPAQNGVTGAIATTLLSSADWTYVGRSGSLTEYRHQAPASRLANAGKQAASLPWFAKNVVLKALIASKVLKRDWPY